MRNEASPPTKKVRLSHAPSDTLFVTSASQTPIRCSQRPRLSQEARSRRTLAIQQALQVEDSSSHNPLLNSSFCSAIFLSSLGGVDHSQPPTQPPGNNTLRNGDERHAVSPQEVSETTSYPIYGITLSDGSSEPPYKVQSTEEISSGGWEDESTLYSSDPRAVAFSVAQSSGAIPSDVFVSVLRGSRIAPSVDAIARAEQTFTVWEEEAINEPLVREDIVDPEMAAQSPLEKSLPDPRSPLSRLDNRLSLPTRFLQDVSFAGAIEESTGPGSHDQSPYHSPRKSHAASVVANRLLNPSVNNTPAKRSVTPRLGLSRTPARSTFRTPFKSERSQSPFMNASALPIASSDILDALRAPQITDSGDLRLKETSANGV